MPVPKCEACKRKDATREMVAKDGTVILLCEACYQDHGDAVQELGFRG